MVYYVATDYFIYWRYFSCFFCDLLIFLTREQINCFYISFIFNPDLCDFSCIKSALTFSVGWDFCEWNQKIKEMNEREQRMSCKTFEYAVLIVTYLMTLLCVCVCMCVFVCVCVCMCVCVCVCVCERRGKGIVPGPIFLKALSDLEATTTAPSSKLSSSLFIQMH